ncbi:hypothetical protein BDFG_09446, partial [Blastomyces dermatitidis ATCC 26199]
QPKFKADNDNRDCIDTGLVEQPPHNQHPTRSACACVTAHREASYGLPYRHTAFAKPTFSPLPAAIGDAGGAPRKATSKIVRLGHTRPIFHYFSSAFLCQPVRMVGEVEIPG